MPDGRWVQLDETHPIFHSFFEINDLHYLPSYGDTPPSYYGIFEKNDPAKRLIALANRDKDIGEYLGVFGHWLRAGRSVEPSVQVWCQLLHLR